MVVYPSQAVAQIPPGSDVTEIQAAIDVISAQGGGIVNFQTGTFTCTDDLLIPSNIALMGTGSGSTIIDFDGGAKGIKVVGTNAYTTGSVTISFGGTTVVGTGTTFTSGMVGQSIMLEDLWYEISAFTDATHITILDTYGGSNLTTNRYAIATTIDNVTIDAMTLQNSSATLLQVTYANNITGENLIISDGNVGLDYDWISGANHPFLTVQSCGTGMTFDDTAFATMYPNAIGNTGDGIVTNHFRNSVIVFASIQGNGGRGLAMQNTNNVGIENCAFQANTGIGIEFIASCFDIQLSVTNVFQGGSDGIKFTATSDSIVVSTSSIHNNAGYGVNIANANCDNNVIVANYFSTNTSGNLSDSGTGTIFQANSPATSDILAAAHARATAQVAANTNILTFATSTSDATYQLLANVLVTSSTLHNFGVTVDYTDEGNTARTLTIPFAQLAGTLVAAITNATGAGPYEGVALAIRCKASTNIVFKTAGTFTTVTYSVDCSVVQIA